MTFVDNEGNHILLVDRVFRCLGSRNVSGLPNTTENFPLLNCSSLAVFIADMFTAEIPNVASLANWSSISAVRGDTTRVIQSVLPPSNSRCLENRNEVA